MFAAALGISASPLWVADDVNMAAPLVQTAPYIPAGTATPVQSVFTFHQFILYNGNVFDPSTAAAGGGSVDPWHNLPLATYMNTVFPGQAANGYASTVVSVSNVH